MMDHKEITENEIIEKYLLGKLSSDEADAFEDHLFFCADCMKELELQRKIIDAIRISAGNEIIKKKGPVIYVPTISDTADTSVRQKRPVIYYLTISFAIAAVLAAIGFIIIPKYYEKQSEKNPLKNLSSRDTIKRNRHIFTPGEFVVEPKQYATNNDTSAKQHEDNEATFAENSKLKSAIEEELAYVEQRGMHLPGLTELSPTDSDDFKSGKIITFKCMSSYDTLTYTLIVYNNIGKEIYIDPNVRSSEYVFEHNFNTQPLKPGLYYWRVLPPKGTDYPHTGKFRIIK